MRGKTCRCDFVFKMMNSAFKLMNFAFKMMQKLVRYPILY